jgi:thiol:disulfide interchange protein DsbC
VTAERRDQIIAEKVKTLPLDKAVTIGNGPNQVIEFTDPDCPYCRKLDAYLSGRKDITRHIFFFPLNIHPKAKDKAQYILCSENPGSAKREVFSGKWDKDLPPLKNCSATLLDDHLRSAGVVGVRGTPTLWINGTKIGGANIEAIASILDNSKTKAQRAQKKEINP